jgi:colanic acid biosynthesis protein WcaH
MDNKLSTQEFIQVVKFAPLIAIDFLLENKNGDFLLGWRTNRPAQNHWFVPGGRIRKGEPFIEAYQRILKSETGLNIPFDKAVFSGLYEHIYPDDNYFGDTSFGTHYIVVAYKIKIDSEYLNLPNEQHTKYRWAGIDEIEHDDEIHQNTKNYFNGFASFAS